LSNDRPKAYGAAILTLRDILSTTEDRPTASTFRGAGRWRFPTKTGSIHIKEQVTMPDKENQTVAYQVGNITFIVTPVYQTAQGESVAAILLRLMKADVERV